VSDQTQGRHDSEPEQPDPELEHRPEHRPEHPGVVELARADLAAGREWKARDRLSGHLADHYDAAALDLLGEVAYTMRDLPAAGAAWFATPRQGEDVDAAVEAWRERYHDHFAQMWRTLPRSVRERTGNKRVDALRRRAELADWPEHEEPATGESGESGAERVEPATRSTPATPSHATPTPVTSASTTPSPAPAGQGSRVDAAVIIAVVIAVFLLACTVVGFVTVLRWVVPG
jgi:hypothetical protein